MKLTSIALPLALIALVGLGGCEGLKQAASSGEEAADPHQGHDSVPGAEQHADEHVEPDTGHGTHEQHTAPSGH